MSFLSAKPPDDDDDLVILDEVGNESDKNSLSPELTVIDKSTIESSPPVPLKPWAKRQIKRLTKLNRSLRSELEKLQGFDSLTLGLPNEPLVVVQFATETITKKYKSQVEKLLTTLLKDELEYGIAATEREEFFTIDTSRHNFNERDDSNCKHPKYPIYRNEMSEVMSDQVEKDVQEHDSRPRNTCFNCSGDHLISECSKPPNRQNIAHNRQEFYYKIGGKQSRYHCDVEPHLTKFKPGILSPQLRKALNLGENCLPMHVYRMRVLGYPPGWLCEAQVNSSGITMYDSEGKEITDIDNLEEGEVNEPRSVKIQYDPKKLIEYPGFNTYPEQGTIDEGVKLGFPPMQENQLKSSLERNMKPPPATPYKRKNDLNSSPKKKLTPRNEVDMDIEENSDDDIGNIEEVDYDKSESSVLTESTSSSNRKIEIRSKSSSEDDEKTGGPRSPSLEDLEEQKQKLMKQLQQASSSNKNYTVSESKFVFLGTPILNANNDCTQLPDATKFAATISEHANFENLPNSTGSYDRMKTLLHRIRQRLT